MRTWQIFAVLGIAVSTSGCGKRVPEPAPHPTTPHISWSFSVGDQENPDKTPICKSDPRSACVFPATTAERQVHAMVHLYFHPAAVNMKYSGTVQLGIFEGSPAAHELKLDATVNVGDSPGTNTVYDIVTSKPGTYHVLINAVATPLPSGPAVTVRDDITVAVR